LGIRLTPGFVAEFTVRANGNDRCPGFFKLSEFVVEAFQLGGSDKSEIKGIEEQHGPFSLVVGETHIREFAFAVGFSFKIGSGRAYLAAGRFARGCHRNSFLKSRRGSGV